MSTATLHVSFSSVGRREEFSMVGHLSPLSLRSSQYNKRELGMAIRHYHRGTGFSGLSRRPQYRSLLSFRSKAEHPASALTTAKLSFVCTYTKVNLISAAMMSFSV